MSIDDQELRAIAFLALRVRRSTHGATAWDEHGLMTNLRKIQNRNLHMTIEHVMRHAADPKAKTPGAILGSFTPAAPTEKPETFAPPHRHEQCLDCGRHLDNCLCGNQTTRLERGDAAAGAAACRAAMGGEG